jgi:hypothetical protein
VGLAQLLLISAIAIQQLEGKDFRNCMLAIFKEILFFNYITAYPQSYFFHYSATSSSQFLNKRSSTTAYPHLYNHYFFSSLQLYKAMSLCNGISALPQSIAEVWTKESCEIANADLQRWNSG